MNKLRNEREVTTDTTEIHRIIKNTKSNYMSTNWTTQKKWINSQKHNPPRLNHEKIENLNRQITNNEMESVMKNCPAPNKSPGPWFHW